MKEISSNSLKAWMLAARPKTLSSAAVPVMIGVSLAWRDVATAHFSWFPAILCFLFAFVMQIDANFVNDYFDFIKGNDDETRMGPRRACAQGWITTRAMKWGIIVTTLLACSIGLPLAFFGGWQLILVGISCVLFCFLYTTKLSYIGMGDILVLIFFGIVPVCFTYYIEVNTVTWSVFMASIACGLVIDKLLLVNNYRDRDNDARVGKMTLVIRIGERNTEYLYLFCGWGAVLLNMVAFFMADYRLWPLIVMGIYLLLHTITWQQMVAINRGKALNKVLGLTARNMFLYGLLLSLSILCRI